MTTIIIVCWISSIYCIMHHYMLMIIEVCFLPPFFHIDVCPGTGTSLPLLYTDKIRLSRVTFFPAFVSHSQKLGIFCGLKTFFNLLDTFPKQKVKMPCSHYEKTNKVAVFLILSNNGLVGYRRCWCLDSCYILGGSCFYAWSRNLPIWHLISCCLSC